MALSQQDYLIKEYDKLNIEIVDLLKEIRSREKYSLTALAAISAWLYTEKVSHHCESFLIQLTSIIPLIIVLIYGFSVKFLYKNIKWIGDYLLNIENYFLYNLTYKNKAGTVKFFGWEKFFEEESKRKSFVKISIGFWIFELIIAIFLIAYTFLF